MPCPLTIVADDYGIGRQTSRGILDLALEGRVTGVVLLVNCPDAERAAREWHAATPPADLGWHPNLTLDRPILAPADVPSLVLPDGRFCPLGAFLRRVFLGRIRAADVQAEWRAQYQRFIDLVGQPPALVTSHHHVSLFPPCDEALFDVLGDEVARPYVRRVVEHGSLLARVSGARFKRTTLSLLGRRAARRASARGLPGCDWLAGVTDPDCVTDDDLWTDWLALLSGAGSVELCCHPGYHDESLVGRDCDAGAGVLRRPQEANVLRAPWFRTACGRAGFVPVRPTGLTRSDRFHKQVGTPEVAPRSGSV